MEITEIITLSGIGLLVGFIGTLIGAGGGFILVPVLLLTHPDLKPEVVVSISMAVVFLNAFSGTIAYARMRRIDYRSAIDFSLATLPGAIIGAFLVNYLPEKTFDKILGLMLMVIAIFLLIRPGFKRKHSEDNGNLVFRNISDNKGNIYTYSFKNRTGLIFSFFVGFISSLLGIGGGIIHVPVMTLLLNFPIHIATATSHFVLSVMALAGSIVHLVQGNLNGQWLTILYVGAGVIIGAQAGAKFSHYAKPQWIMYGLAGALFIVGLRIMI